MSKLVESLKSVPLDVRWQLKIEDGSVLQTGIGGIPDAVLPMLALLCMARQRGCKLSELSSDLPKRFTASDRLQSFATNKSHLLIQSLLADAQQMAQTLAPNSGPVAAIDQTDGLRVTFANHNIVHLRPSGNAPELRCYAESDTVEAAKALCDDCLARISSL